MKRLDTTGAGHIALIAVVLVVLGAGFAAYRVTSVKPSNSTNSGTSAQSTKYKTTADVKNASKALDSTDVDKSLDSSQLDTDLNDLL